MPCDVRFFILINVRSSDLLSYPERQSAPIENRTSQLRPLLDQFKGSS